MSCAYLAHLYMHVLGKDIVLGVLTVPAYIIQNTHACLQVADTVHPEYPSIHWDPLGAIPYPATGFQPSVQTCGRLEETLGSS